jgi:predicted NAD/FAD-binding protein
VTGTAAGSHKHIAVVGSGVAGLSAAWLLSRRHRVTLFEQNTRPGGHSNTVEVADTDGPVAVDTGFIVYNERNYPNLTALFEHLDVATAPSDMSFSASLRGGALEYAGSDLGGLFAQPRNLVRPRFWRMLADLRRFYQAAGGYPELSDPDLTIEGLLKRRGYSEAFARDHLLPMAAAIWSASHRDIARYPARAFVEFFANHGLLQVTDRPQWRTVHGGSREYVRRLAAVLGPGARCGIGVRRIERSAQRVMLTLCDGHAQRFDDVVIATHADEALRLLAVPSAQERRLLGAFRYAPNHAVLHEDPALMPRRRRAWASWNYLEFGEPAADAALCVTYWMNRLQPLRTARELFVTLNPARAPDPRRVHYETTYRHPQFDSRALRAQSRLWELQGRQRTWFCGSYFGHGFHEDALQAGLYVAERLGDVVRPWPAPAVSRIALPPAGLAVGLSDAA